MSRWADWFAITLEQTEQFREASRESEQAVSTMLEPLLKKGGAVQMDKAWEPIHRCLTEDHSPRGALDYEAGQYPLDLCVFGGDQLLGDEFRTLSLIDPDAVPYVAEALEDVSKPWMRERFFALPDDQFYEIDEEMFEWMWEHFLKLLPFFEQAAKDEQAVLCTVSH